MSAVKCQACGALWLADAPEKIVEANEGCLRCNGLLVLLDDDRVEQELAQPSRPEK
ncbi:MAG: hypothetical protein ACR2K9_01105 [Solirubrobacteraceae bacterium]